MTIRERLLELAETRIEAVWIERLMSDAHDGAHGSRQRAWEQFHERRHERSRFHRHIDRF